MSYKYSVQERRYRGMCAVGHLLASEAVGKFRKYLLLSANLGLPVMSKSINIRAFFADNTSTLIVIDISQHRK